MKNEKLNSPDNGNSSEMQSDIESYKKYKAGFQITGFINRTDFNVGPPDPFDISTDVMIKADGEFFKQ